jgi:hypothetical protein
MTNTERAIEEYLRKSANEAEPRRQHTQMVFEAEGSLEVKGE